MSEIKLKKRFKYAGDIYKVLLDTEWDAETAAAFLNSIPDADVEEVVRCKKCKHTDTDGCGAIYCEKWDRWEMPEDFFCGYGERKYDE